MFYFTERFTCKKMAKLNKKMKMKSKSAGGGGNTQAMQFNHALGQHILKNPLIIQALVEKVFFSFFLDSSDQDIFVPVGPQTHRHGAGDWSRNW